MNIEAKSSKKDARTVSWVALAVTIALGAFSLITDGAISLASLLLATGAGGLAFGMAKPRFQMLCVALVLIAIIMRLLIVGSSVTGMAA